ncbi:MAG: thiamine phosphate synthase [Sulfurimonas sp. RIFCSPLOWO2_12_FULL_36_74]|uniref:thiamine phosphate synthase n=1 Tax=unclassified Sulfurimonas TaxID=2623549 RepID=UPI0008AFC910|nr:MULTISPECIES: thiamine phosphate synthase [unclassified Sulfurimonas]OHD97418.1 MAG: thiamine phosphate synthase [Sulfurimonas sp. RIFCSPLOWO2_02_FULL_36_28]OHE01968.1 MAG: thiamine phosphate synthase [Sulfurimonas sp. RIFCSPLOWO2_12_36_12]OHE04146.1 MAG: thiamine phosphate synthase [Sulfurimonas sp. RIFCSPLOWO2_12_FULL_36_74]
MRLYALCDQDLLDKKGLSLEDFVEIAKQKNAEIIQYRNKNADIAFIKQQLIKIRKMYDGFLIVNDAYELIEFCDGVHVGQEDLKAIDNDIFKAVKILRNVINKEKLLGISTHNKEEVLQANLMDLNYIGLGAYRDTSTKDNISAILGEKLDDIASLSKHYVAAIGGVKEGDKFSHITYHVIGSGLL